MSPQSRDMSKDDREAHFEVERRFLIDRLPDGIETYPHRELLQGYVTFYFEAADGTEVRLRSDGSTYIETLKRGSGGVRWESERDLTKEEFDERWRQVGDRSVAKTRYELPGGIELDIFHGRFEGLAIAEIEFADEAASTDFTPPHWFGREITENYRYTHQSLLLDGLPATEEGERRGPV
jgi:CYTH domain-containing protein